RFTPDRLGEYPLICAELCGPYHGAMNTKVVVETQQDFDKWMTEQQASASRDLNQAVAVVDRANLPPDELLAPYTKEMGIQSEMLQHIHSSHH
ncbi:MAG: cytochrome C oxidase subunit II, partial [Chroococcidiopsidaceae cyanobacterium CP_BM_RX_35]|nr:cytochrome C oxidase subunit II [Chroococcidiopsidaceae cyanobacterium CP_BM_RX_35]